MYPKHLFLCVQAASLLALPGLANARPAPHSKRQDAGTYDFIIVGGGTTGLALASRLSENETQSVLVLEAGGSPEAVASYQAPGADLQVLGSPIDWAFTTLPQSSLAGRQLTYNRGRVLEAVLPSTVSPTEEARQRFTIRGRLSAIRAGVGMMYSLISSRYACLPLKYNKRC